MSSSQPTKRSHRSIRKIFPVAAVVIVLVCLFTVAAQAFGLFNLGDFWTQIRSDSFQVSSNAVPHASIKKVPLEEGEQETYDTLQEALDAFGITVPLAPQRVPERFTLASVKAIHQSGGIIIYAEYTSDDGYLVIRYYEVTPDTEDFESMGPEVTMYPCGGLEHFLMPNLEQYKAYWRNGELNCSIDGMVSKDEMVQMIESIYEGE